MSATTLGPTSDDIACLFIQHQIVPDVVSQPPNKKLILVYDDGTTVHGGNEQPISSTQSPPNVSLPTATSSYYSLLMLDPDNDTRTTYRYRQFLHWFVINIPGMSGGQGVDVNKGFTVSPYMGCAPDPGSGRHRYVFLLYEQQVFIPTENIKVLGNAKMFGLMANLDERKCFDIARWYNENASGQQPTLIAGNSFFAEKL